MSYLNRKDYDNHIHCRTVRWRLNRICDFFGNGGFVFQLGKVMCLQLFLNQHCVHCFYWTFVCSNVLCIDHNLLSKIFYTVSSKNQIFSAKINLHTLKANVEEGRVAKTLGTAMVVFTFCWPPQFASSLLHTGYPLYLDRCTLHTGSWSIWVALSTPFIYGATNRRFWIEGKVILRKVFLQ